MEKTRKNSCVNTSPLRNQASAVVEEVTDQILSDLIEDHE